jgi:hypothetical protein
MHPIDQQLNLMIRGNFTEARIISDKLENEIPNDLRHMFNRGWFVVRDGDFVRGYQLLDAGRMLNVYGDPRLNTPQPIWDRSDLHNKTIIINLEGGFGDQLIYARFATKLAELGANCIICGHPQLKTLLQSIPGVSRVINLTEVSSTPHDYWAPSFSLVWLLNYTPTTMIKTPYITPPANSVSAWKQFIDSDKIKVGIRWSGNPEFEHQQFRVFPPEGLINLCKYDNIQLYSFQRDNDTRELPDSIIDLQYLLLSWDDTAAAISQMDLVISSCTSVAHLAAAMGKPTWIILPILPYHIWAYGEDTKSVWYEDTVKLFRQTTFGYWDVPLQNVELELIKKFQLK